MKEEFILDLERKVIRLEENSWFQERKILELEEHAKELRLQLDAVNRQMEIMQQAFLHLQDEFMAARSGTGGLINPPPPHWGQEK